MVFRTGETVLNVAPPVIETSRGAVVAERAVVCPGDDFATLFPERIEAYRPRRCRLTMLRLADPGFRWPAGVMSDLGLARYRGYADLPEAQALKRRLEAEQGPHLAHGVHLIAVQNADGSLVVGDSHHYDDLPGPFAPAEAETLILDEFEQATGLRPAAGAGALDRRLRRVGRAGLFRGRALAGGAAGHRDQRHRRLHRLRHRRGDHRRSVRRPGQSPMTRDEIVSCLKRALNSRCRA